MRFYKVLICSLFLLVANNISYAQSNEVKLVVSSDGPTKEEATKNALRSAIEQAYGTFVSANTEILNDELIKDEIVSVSSGNIKSYKELSCEMYNGFYSVTVETIVSIGKLVSFAQNHGASAEFAGQTFAMNMRIRELNKNNEAIALEQLLFTLKNYKALYDFSISLEEPKALSFEQWVAKGDRPPFEFKYTMKLKITTLANNNYKLFVSALKNTLSALSLSLDERVAYANNDIPYTVLAFPVFGGYRVDGQYVDVTDFYCLRNDLGVIRSFSERILSMLSKEMEAFTLLQNNMDGVTRYMLSSGYHREPLIYREKESNYVSLSKPILCVVNKNDAPILSYPELTRHKDYGGGEYVPYHAIDEVISPADVFKVSGSFLAEQRDSYNNVSLYHRYRIMDRTRTLGVKGLRGLIVQSLNNDNIAPFEKDIKEFELFFTSNVISNIKGFDIIPTYVSPQDNSIYSRTEMEKGKNDNYSAKTSNIVSFDDVATKPSAKGYKTKTLFTLLKSGIGTYCYFGSESELFHVGFVVNESGTVKDITYGDGVPDKAKDSIRLLLEWLKWSPGKDANGNAVPVRIDIDAAKSDLSKKMMTDYLKFAHNAKLPQL